MSPSFFSEHVNVVMKAGKLGMRRIGMEFLEKGENGDCLAFCTHLI